jgi:endonuclease/exonuclease/phosphatase (EEP) superfamily protein YafD
MKILFLNAWNGKLKEELQSFISAMRSSVDVFCFQEFTPEMSLWCTSLLASTYEMYTAEKKVTEEDFFHIATYVRKSFSVTHSQVLLQHDFTVGLGLYTEISYNERSLSLCNVHGISRPGDKLDNPDRLKQSNEIISYLNSRDGEKIIGGDFNLDLHTESVSLFTTHGYRNLIEEFSIPTTRNDYAWSRYPDNKQPYADFVFISQNISLSSFMVSPELVSDHLAMIVEF